MKLISMLSVIFFAACSQQPENVVKPARKLTLVAFQPYKDFDSSLLHFVSVETETFYHCKVVILPPAALPANAFYKPRARYKADSLLLFQKSLLPPGANTIAGLTAMDISTSNGSTSDWGVFGIGSCPGNTCVISVYRLRSTTLQQFKERFIKVILHELGHNLGLPHCNQDSSCLMNDAKGTISQVDKEKKWLCPACQQLLSK